MKPPDFSDYIVYVDESGHASPDPDPLFPCFVLAFCLFEKKHYLGSTVPALQRLKFEFFGHDMVIFHEREIRKSTGEFSILLDRRVRPPFFAALNGLLEEAEFAILHSTLIKDGAHQKDDNLYHIAALACLESLFEKLSDLRAIDKTTHVVFEERGKSEDRLLELEFRRICAGENRHERPYPFRPVFASKKANSCGLQIADLVARPIGLSQIRPDQPNRAFEILKGKDIRPKLEQTEFDL